MKTLALLLVIVAVAYCRYYPKQRQSSYQNQWKSMAQNPFANFGQAMNALGKLTQFSKQISNLQKVTSGFPRMGEAGNSMDALRKIEEVTSHLKNLQNTMKNLNLGSNFNNFKRMNSKKMSFMKKYFNKKFMKNFRPFHKLKAIGMELRKHHRKGPHYPHKRHHKRPHHGGRHHGGRHHGGRHHGGRHYPHHHKRHYPHHHKRHYPHHHKRHYPHHKRNYTEWERENNDTYGEWENMNYTTPDNGGWENTKNITEEDMWGNMNYTAPVDGGWENITEEEWEKMNYTTPVDGGWENITEEDWENMNYTTPVDEGMWGNGENYTTDMEPAREDYDEDDHIVGPDTLGPMHDENDHYPDWSNNGNIWRDEPTETEWETEPWEKEEYSEDGSDWSKQTWPFNGRSDGMTNSDDFNTDTMTTDDDTTDDMTTDDMTTDDDTTDGMTTDDDMTDDVDPTEEYTTGGDDDVTTETHSTTDEDTRSPWGNLFTGLTKGWKFPMGKWMKKTMKTFHKGFPDITSGGLFPDMTTINKKVKDQMSKTMHKLTTTIPKNPCELCNTVISYLSISRDMGNSYGMPTQEQVRSTVDELCKKLEGFETTKLCTAVKTKLEHMLRHVMNNTNSTEICELIGVRECQPSKDTFTSIETSTTRHHVTPPDCNNMCNRMTSSFDKGLKKWRMQIDSAKAGITAFCRENNINVKCELPLKALDKMMNGITTAAREISTPSTFVKSEECQCFETHIPMTMTETSTDCTLCKTLATVLEKKMENPLKDMKTFIETINKDICETYPRFETECKMFVTTMERLVREELTVTNFCEELRFCPDRKMTQTYMKKMISTYGNPSTGMSPFLTRGLPMFGNRMERKKKFLCKRCKKTMSHVGYKLPAMKNNLSLMCTTMGAGNEQIKTTCERMRNEMEKLHSHFGTNMSNMCERMC